MNKTIILLLTVILSTITLFSQKTEVLRSSVEAVKYSRINTPVSIDLAEIIVNDTLSLLHFEQVKGKPVEIPC